MAAFVASLLLQAGDRPVRLVAALAAATARPGAVIAGAVLAVIASNAAAVGFGALLAPLVPGRAGQLLLALALLSAGASGLARLKDAPGERSRLGAFGGALFGCLALALGDRSQFVTTALAAHGTLPVLAGIGGALGSLAVVVPAALAGDELRALPPRPVRIVPAIPILAIGAWLALGAVGLL